MDSKCPKCGKKLSIFYVKQCCPECGCNLMYYNMENRLEKDAQKAEKEWANINKIVESVSKLFKRKKSVKKGKKDEK